MGKVEEAKAYMAAKREGWADPPTWKKLAPDALRFLRDLDVALWSDDPSSAFAVLHAREREVIEQLGIAEIWRPTPFPGEPGGGVSKITDREAFLDIFRDATKRAAAMMRFRIDPLLLSVEKPKLRNYKPKRKKPATG